MALPSAVDDAFTKVRHAADALGKAHAESEAARRSTDEDRMKKATNDVQRAARELAMRARQLEETAKKV